jgi:hypothetical protein
MPGAQETTQPATIWRTSSRSSTAAPSSSRKYGPQRPICDCSWREYQSVNGVEIERWLEPDGTVERERSVREEPLRQTITTDYPPHYGARRIETWQGDGGVEVRSELPAADGGWVLENRRVRSLHEPIR